MYVEHVVDIQNKLMSALIVNCNSMCVGRFFLLNTMKTYIPGVHTRVKTFQYYSPSASGLHVNVRNGAGYSPLHVAAQCGRDALVDLLMKRGADVHAKTALHRYTPLHLAYKHGMTEVRPVVP